MGKIDDLVIPVEEQRKDSCIRNLHALMDLYKANSLVEFDQIVSRRNWYSFFLEEMTGEQHFEYRCFDNVWRTASEVSFDTSVPMILKPVVKCYLRVDTDNDVAMTNESMKKHFDKFTDFACIYDRYNNDEKRIEYRLVTPELYLDYESPKTVITQFEFVQTDLRKHRTRMAVEQNFVTGIYGL